MDLGQFQTFRVAACDLNGQMRGKVVPGSYAEKLESGAVRMPLSVLNLDLWGEDIEDSPLVFETGDADGVLRPTGRAPMPVPWLDAQSALVPMSMYTDEGAAFEGDPRHALARVLTRFKARGWTPIAATEMEFTLLDDSGAHPQAPVNPRSGRPLDGSAILSMSQMDAFAPFFDDLYAGAFAMGIPAETAISEAGVGQFEVTMRHGPAMEMADNAWAFKALVRGLARKHAMAATFMAKPYPGDAGNGMHVHVSVVDQDGNNVFDNGGPDGTETMRQAVAGCLAAMPGSSLIFAPHTNSYDRFVAGAHAPTAAAWGYENRTVAVRIPGGPNAARRVEHRTAGGDINPYLLLSAVLGSVMIGIDDQMVPPAPVVGNAYDANLPGLATNLSDAIDAFETDPFMARIFHPQLIDNLIMTKRQELKKMMDVPADQRWKAMLERV
ncbi:Gamma-glutamylputrescine synthetase PuuA [Ascidiaceihabitans donghaensis]|uniref:Gamma-glutamylputrescine synthetase PuuA n=1 Tax=Ascidiaceihabitans donghaensis TaxID=1510460 RepID=A0A2R8BG02_9RHOB|nr:glutamine synthetase family protein [Ascidiaceihabitans donghaensis]SPH21932.1 Gamma-glutamylputrescine synthetase PuuA [Ascidiaceihabitans donghaensis]